ncbi:MAG: IclR family transcriptional regulator [Ilumatobacteraceae bacterium]
MDKKRGDTGAGAGRTARTTRTRDASPSTARSRGSTTSVERAIDVLMLFTTSQGSTLGITEIANDLGISKAVVHRILTSLCDLDVVIADPESRRYSLGPGVLQLAAAYRNRLDLRALAHQTLVQLSNTTDETATLSLRHGWQRAYVDQVTPDREVAMTVSLGRAFPLHAGASSKAFLAFVPAAEIDEYLESQPLDALTARTIVDRAALRDELESIRRVGYAASFGERQSGAASVAAPVMADTGAGSGPVGVISICGPLERFTPLTNDFARRLVEATTALSIRLGYSSPQS